MLPCCANAGGCELKSKLLRCVCSSTPKPTPAPCSLRQVSQSRPKIQRRPDHKTCARTETEQRKTKRKAQNRFKPKARSTQGGEGLLSQPICNTRTQESMAKNPSPREERERTERGEGAWEGEATPLFLRKGPKKKREPERDG